jgi:hypothetical protein
MAASAHRVRRLLWRIRLESPEEAFALRARLTATVETEVLPELQRLFEALPPGDDSIRIERLDISVRVPEVDALERATVAAIRQQLYSQLAELIEPSGASAQEHEVPVRRATVRLSSLESLLHYLETGALPWYAEPAGPDLTCVRELELTAVNEMTAVLRRLPASAAATAVYLFRLLSLLPESAWVSVVHAVARHRHRREEPEIIEAVERIATAPERSSARHARIELAAAIIAGWFTPVESLDGPSPREKPTVSSDAQRLFDRLALPTRVGTPINSPRFASGPEGSGPAATPPLDDPAAGAAASGDEDRAFGVPVSYAGLVMLAPMLPRLFAARNVAHPGVQALNAEALRRAAALLHFAATGEHNGHEYELGLIKILLGVPMDQPILIASGILNRGDREEVEEVLSDVVEHWGIVRRMSIDGLRQTFLQRRGLLMDARGSWRLCVEDGRIDTLLDHLPWGLTSVTLPWLPSPIAIDWPRP